MPLAAVSLQRLTVGVEGGHANFVTDWTDYITKQFPPFPARKVDTMRLAWQSFGPALLVALGWAALAWQHPPALYMSSGSLSARHSAMLTESKHFIYSIKSNHIMCYSQHDTGNTATANAEHRDEFVRSLPGVNQTTHLSTHLPHLSSKRMWSPLGNSRCWSSVAVVLMTLMIAGGV